MARLADLRSRAVLRTADELGIPHAHAVGLRELLYATAFQKADATIGDERDVELSAGWDGDRGLFVAAARAAGMIVEVEPGLFVLPDFEEAAPSWSKKRAKSAEARMVAGKTISDLRAEAGLKGAAVRASKRGPNGKQTGSKRQQTEPLPPFLPTSPPSVPPAFEKEEREGAPLSQASPLTGRPTLEEWKAYASETFPGWPETDIASSFDDVEAKGWPRGDWHARCRKYHAAHLRLVADAKAKLSPVERERLATRETIARARGGASS